MAGNKHIPFKSKSNGRVKAEVTRYAMVFTFYESVEAWTEGKLPNKRTIECSNIPSACGIFHESVKKTYPNYFIKDIDISPVVKVDGGEQNDTGND